MRGYHVELRMKWSGLRSYRVLRLHNQRKCQVETGAIPIARFHQLLVQDK